MSTANRPHDVAPTPFAGPLRNDRTKRVDLKALARALQFAVHQLRSSQAPTMAANLAFRTLFGLLPVLVVATIVARALLGDGFDDLVSSATRTLGLHEVTIATEGDSAAVPLGVWVESIAAEAAKIDLSAIGLVGALAVLFSAIWTMVAIESSFNAIYRAPSGRPFVRRVLIYWFVITAGPVLFAAIPLAFRAGADAIGADSTAAVLATKFFSLVGGFVSLWILLTAAFATVPNAKVELRAAIAGAFVATLLVEIGKRSLGASLAGSFSASRLYGSLGLVPLLMLWIYLMWLVVLFGLQVAAILQGFGRNGRLLAAGAHAPDILEPAEAIPCFRAVCEQFRLGRGASADTLVRNCSITPSNARLLLAAFERARLAHRIDGDERRYAPSRPPELILQSEVLRAGFAVVDGGAEYHVHHQLDDPLGHQRDDDIGALRAAQVAHLGAETFASHDARRVNT